MRINMYYETMCLPQRFRIGKYCEGNGIYVTVHGVAVQRGFILPAFWAVCCLWRGGSGAVSHLNPVFNIF